ncbi:MAG: LamG-like jellyroll fold domain-containing protein [Kiritimatiellia bacterium]
MNTSALRLLPLAAVLLAPATPAREHTFVFTAPPRNVPTRGMPDGPLLGNGDVGVVLAGPPEAQRFHIGKNDFWTNTPGQAKIITVGRIELEIPGLRGASYRQEQDLAKAEVRGTFTKDALTVQTRSWVDATENLLFVEITSTGGPATLSATLARGESPSAPSQPQPGAPLQVGREQHGGGRWYFDGGMADLVVTNTVLAAKPVGERGREEMFDGRSTWRVLPEPKITDTVSVGAWIRINATSPEANYIVSKGEWNRSYSLGLSNGCLRWTVNGVMLQSAAPLPKGRWIYVLGTLADGRMAAYVDGECVGAIGKGSDSGSFFVRKADAPGVKGREVAVAAWLAGHPELRATLQPGVPVVLTAAIFSDLDHPDFAAAARARVAELDAAGVAARTIRHRRWWADFWSRSFIEIPDQEIEKRWYAALYVMASCSRPGEVAPGLWGNWVTTDHPNWQGDFHLNYNFQAPFYLVYGCNQTDLARPFFPPVMDWMPQARDFARERGWKGVHYPVSIGPWASCSYSPRLDLGQRSDAAYASLNFIWYWQYTQDRDWLKATGYPFLREVAEFWEDYLKLEGGRYVIHNDSIHEGSGNDTNPILTLGLLRNLFKNMIPMSEELGLDADRRATWQDILVRLSPFPLQERGGKTVFRYSEKGTAWWNDNTLGIQHIFPSGAIGLDSDPRLLEISHNMINAMNRWADYNGFSSWYTACARVGYDPKVILARLRAECDKHSFPNGLLYYGGGGIESCGGFLAINEMLMQSHEGVLRLFPCWPLDQNARFGDLLAVGAFRVSATLNDGVVSGVRIVSEKGRPCLIQNPWPGRAVNVVRNGVQGVPVAAAARFTLETAPGEVLELSPK